MAGSATSEEGDIGFQIAPMVDVVFVLMLFFMACAGWQIREHELNVQLPAKVARGAETAVTIDISADGQIVANGQSFGRPTDKQLPAFRDWLKTVRDFGGETPVFLRPRPAARHERIMDVINACRAAGLEKVSFAP